MMANSSAMWAESPEKQVAPSIELPSQKMAQPAPLTTIVTSSLR
jgi:hypothetical protein